MSELASTCCTAAPASYFQTYEEDGVILGVCINCMDHAEFEEEDDD